MQWTIPSKIQYTNVLTEFPLVLIVKGPWPGEGGRGGLSYETDEDTHKTPNKNMSVCLSVCLPILSFRGVNFGFWSCLGCSGQSTNIYATKVSFIVPRRNTELREEKQNSDFLQI